MNRAIPSKIYLTEGKEGKRPFVAMIFSPGQTGVMDRSCQCHKSFDQWQEQGRHFVCRIKVNTKRTCIRVSPTPTDSIVPYDAVVLLGTPDGNRTQKEVRVVAYRIDNVDYWVAPDRHDLSAEQIAFVYKLRWQIEKLFAWWKRHMKVYHLIARTEYGLMVQILSILITFLPLAIHCHKPTEKGSASKESDSSVSRSRMNFAIPGKNPSLRIWECGLEMFCMQAPNRTLLGYGLRQRLIKPRSRLFGLLELLYYGFYGSFAEL